MSSSIFAQQKEFMDAFDLKTSNTPCFDPDRFYFWDKLIQEEHEEWWKATGHLLGKQDSIDVLAEVAQETIDLIYVLCGFANALGLQAEEVWNEVHRANMDKVGEDGKVVKDENGKVQKPEGWQPANIKKIIQNKIGE